MAVSKTARRGSTPYHNSVLRRVPLRHIFTGVTFTRTWTVRLEQQGDDQESTREQLLLSEALISSAHVTAQTVHLQIDRKESVVLLEIIACPQTVYAITCTCRHVHYRVHQYLDEQNLLTCFHSSISQSHCITNHVFEGDIQCPTQQQKNCWKINGVAGYLPPSPKTVSWGYNGYKSECTLHVLFSCMFS